MGRTADPATRRRWQQRLRRFERSSLTVAEFCEAEAVSAASFYLWRKKLGHALDDGSSGPRAALQSTGRQVEPVQGFLPVQIVQPSAVEIHLPNGVRLAVPSGDLTALRAAIMAAGQLPDAARAEVAAC